MSTFKVVANTDYDEFCLQVQDAVREGWTTRGDELFLEEKYIQCFIRFKETNNELVA